MYVHKVKIKKFKVLEDFETDFEGRNILLIGDNGVGKSSVMQLIQIAMGDTSNIPPDATGEGHVVIDKNGEKYIFHVKFKDGKPQLTVTAPNGLKDTRKSVVAGLVGAINFNVNEFVKLSESTAGRKKQVEIYKGLLPKDIIEGIDALERQNKSSYDERTEVNRKAKTLEGFIRESPLFGNEINVTEIDVSGLNKQIQEATAANEKIVGIASGIDERKRKVKANSDRMVLLKKELAELETETDKNTEEITKGELWLLKNPKIDTTELYTQVNAASESNKTVELAKEHKRKLAELEKFTEEAGELTVLIDTNRQAIQDAIRDMDTLVEGLSFDAEQLIYNGVPVSEASLSTSEIIHLGVKLKFAQNPESPLFIEHGESLGTKRYNEIKQMAKGHGLQMFMEQVERDTQELKIEFIND